MTQETYVFLNDAWVAPEQARVPVEDRGFQFGDGIYEVVRIYRGRPFAMWPHLERLERSARELELPLPRPLPELARLIEEAPARRGLQEATVYLQLTRGYAPRIHYFPDHVTPTLVVYAQPIRLQPEEGYERGAAAIVVPDERWLRCDIKSVNLLPNALAKERARRAGVLEAILHREGVGITEGSSTNVFAVCRGKLVTAPAGRYILRGVTRDIVLELARAAGIAVEERFLSREELLAADEVFITSTTLEVMPIARIDGQPVGEGRPGPVARRLRDAFRARVAEETR